MKRKALLVVIVLAILGSALILPNNANASVTITGTVCHISIEGGFWGIITDNGKRFNPGNNLPDELKKNGVRAKFTLSVLSDAVSVYMWGKEAVVVAYKIVGQGEKNICSSLQK